MGKCVQCNNRVRFMICKAIVEEIFSIQIERHKWAADEENMKDVVEIGRYIRFK